MLIRVLLSPRFQDRRQRLREPYARRQGGGGKEGGRAGLQGQDGRTGTCIFTFFKIELFREIKILHQEIEALL